MSDTIGFILNDREVEAASHPATPLLDYIRGEAGLCGTKIGCREGDCGACAVLVGSLEEGEVCYRAMTSCLTPLGNAAGKHVVTVEGLNREELNPVQEAIVTEGGVQCGFCTPGFVVSLAGFCLGDAEPTPAAGVAAMDGNICRCTGYKSLERAAARIAGLLARRDDGDRLSWLTAQGFLPDYFPGIPARLTDLERRHERPSPPAAACFLGGGTDLMVQKPDDLPGLDVALLFPREDLRDISMENGRCLVGAGVTAEMMREDPLLTGLFPGMDGYMRLVASTPIRHMATIGGNLVNASPIGDMTIMFLALDAELALQSPAGERRLPLRRFYHGYKRLDKGPDELLTALRFEPPGATVRFNFEKVSKRTHLDIASVNSAILVEAQDGRIVRAGISAGGVAPIPLFLEKASGWLAGRPLCADTVREAADRAMVEASPIDDVRGSAEYKRLLLRQLIYAHFLTLFPEEVDPEALL